MHDNMMADADDFMARRVKKDVLWKPLLRGFRSFYRSELNRAINFQSVNDPLATDLGQ